MPDSAGFYHLSDAPPRIGIMCSVCPRHGSYDRDLQLAELGDIVLPDFLAHVSRDCPQRSHEVNSIKCGARYAPESIAVLPVRKGRG